MAVEPHLPGLPVVWHASGRRRAPRTLRPRHCAGCGKHPGDSERVPSGGRRPHEAVSPRPGL